MPCSCSARCPIRQMIPGDGAYCWHPEGGQSGCEPVPGLLSNLCSDDRISVGGDRATARVGEGLSRVGLCDLYVAGSDVKDIVAQYRLRPDLDGQIRLHVVPEGLPRELTSGGPAESCCPRLVPLISIRTTRAPAGPRFCQLSTMCAALASPSSDPRGTCLTSPDHPAPRGSKADGSGDAC